MQNKVIFQNVSYIFFFSFNRFAHDSPMSQRAEIWPRGVRRSISQLQAIRRPTFVKIFFAGPEKQAKKCKSSFFSTLTLNCEEMLLVSPQLISTRYVRLNGQQICENRMSISTFSRYDMALGMESTHFSASSLIGFGYHALPVACVVHVSIPENAGGSGQQIPHPTVTHLPITWAQGAKFKFPPNKLQTVITIEPKVFCQN